jgi:hypothetical protein
MSARNGPDFCSGLYPLPRLRGALDGAIAQLGERLHGMQEVGGSIPPGSTTKSLFLLCFYIFDALSHIE